MPSETVLVIGATGYVGGRLVPLLLASGYRVRAMGRSLKKLEGRSWAGHPLAELAEGDVLDPESLSRACEGCRAAFYLVHSMIAAGRDFVKADRVGARNMVAAAARAGLDRIIYLGGLAQAREHALSEHLQSREEVARILQSGPVPTTDLRASVILGAGSASFEILRYTVERFPLMLAPAWVRTRTQPIAIRDVLLYLRGCLETDAVRGQTLDIGGPDVLSYDRLAEIYAKEAGLPPRRIIPVPFITPAVSSFMIRYFSPVPADIAVPLVEGLRNESVCEDQRIRELIPLEPTGCRDTIRMALKRIRENEVETCWSDAGCLLPPEWTYCGDAEYTGGTIAECGYRVELAATPAEVWRPVVRIGGDTGWYFGDLLWKFRGLLDQMIGGIGLRRGRRHPVRLQAGDALDFWRVLEAEPETRLLLLAEMALPGEALLDIRITPAGDGKTELQFLTRFMPRGLWGLIYWYALYPFHQFIFRGMLKGVARSVGRPVVRGPERFTPKIPDHCPPPWDGADT
ncbi:DUF2867 domain-containing protein [Desulfonema ishimotonii]|uniref:DUF2867 domain-containing protein n=1 Tax=Desulfonema ishimotonii TaxID=45657 RepID=A0A401G2I5_9BACT|nr:SDR family oxidoreductase [Desulfonema ishimotonii]GBC63437.1 DUF2867 domain-containing protein [Desulfonema ishimotonii]